MRKCEIAPKKKERELRNIKEFLRIENLVETERVEKINLVKLIFFVY